MWKNFVKWSAKKFNTKFGEILNLSLSMEDLESLPQTNGYIKMSIAPRKEVGPYGDTHYVYENEFVADPAKAKAATATKKK